MQSEASLEVKSDLVKQCCWATVACFFAPLCLHIKELQDIRYQARQMEELQPLQGCKLVITWRLLDDQAAASLNRAALPGIGKLGHAA